MIRQKSDAVDRFSFFENLSQQVSKTPSTGVFFSGNEAFIKDDIASGKIIVRDGRHDSDIFYDFKTGDTLRLTDFIMPSFNARCKFVFFIIKRQIISFIESLQIPKRKMGRCSIQIKIVEDDIEFTIFTKKNEILGKFKQKLFFARYKVRNISVFSGLCVRCNLLYFKEILFHSFKEYDIIGLRADKNDYFYLFGHCPKKPHIVWRLEGV